MLHTQQDAPRQARCPSCQGLADSRPDLPFYEFRGEGSKAATETCATCRFSIEAHRRKADGLLVTSMNKYVCDAFTPFGPWRFDSYYCGCRGWD